MRYIYSLRSVSPKYRMADFHDLWTDNSLLYGTVSFICKGMCTQVCFKTWRIQKSWLKVSMMMGNTLKQLFKTENLFL